MKRILIVYYSYSGATRSLAEDIAILTGGDLRELVPQQPYSFAHNGAAKEVRRQMERGDCPRLLSGDQPVTGYESILVGSPNWFKSFAPPVLSFLRGAGVAEQRVIPFCTHGGGGSGNIPEQMARECPGAELLPGFASDGSHGEAQLRQWLGELELLP